MSPYTAIENTEPVDNVDWIEIIERKPVMHILLNVAKKMIKEKIRRKKDFIKTIFG